MTCRMVGGRWPSAGPNTKDDRRSPALGGRSAGRGAVRADPADRRHGKADRARTVKRRAMLACGIHPATGLPLLGRETCGTCVHHFVRQFAGAYHKCRLVRSTGGPATDIRVSWPACEKWQSEELG